MRRIVFVLAILAVSTLALAKIDPYVEDPENEWGDLSEPYEVWSVEAALGIFGQLNTEEDIDAFAYTFEEPYEDWSFQLMVPVCGTWFEDFYPSIALVGPGLSEPELSTKKDLKAKVDTKAEELPFEVPEGMGIEIFTEEKAEVDREIMTNIGFFANAYQFTVREVDIPESGTYMLVVWEPQGQIGAYAVSNGIQHDKFQSRPQEEFSRAMDLYISGDWMGQDCSATKTVKK
jgi:hypothetical protein